MSITLSGGIPQWFVDQFSASLYHVCQQTESFLGGAVRVEPLVGAEDKSFDMLDQFELVDKMTRNPDTPIIEAATQRRWVETAPAHQGILYDKDDDLSMLLNPLGDYQLGFVRAVHRKKDAVILAALGGDVKTGRTKGSGTTIDGSYYYGPDDGAYYDGTPIGDDTEGYDHRVIAHDCSYGNCDAAETGMTPEKLEVAAEYFKMNYVDPSVPKFCVMSPKQITELLGHIQITSSDYSRLKRLETGTVESFMGFNIIPWPGITKGSANCLNSTTSVYKCWCWTQDAIILAIQDAVSVDISVRADKSNSQQVYVHMNMGAIRFDEDKVCLIESE